MFLVLVLMVGLHMKHIQAESKERVEAKMEKLKPISETTTKIEMASFKLRMWGIRNQHMLPEDLSDALDDNADAWGKPMRIEHEGSPPTGYLIASAGEDGEFSTGDDVAIRFDMNHEQIGRINTYGLEEMKVETDAAMSVLNGDGAEEQPGGRFTYSNGVNQVLIERDANYIMSLCNSERDVSRLSDIIGNAQERLMDHIEAVDSRAKTSVPGGMFTDEQWKEVLEIANEISVEEMTPIYESLLREAGISPVKK